MSIIIPTFNRSELLNKSLTALAEQTVPADRFEVIVVDDGSTDDTASVLGATITPYDLTYISIEHSGAGAARNTGVAVASAAIVCFLDDDILADTNLVEAHLAGHSAHPGSVLVGKIDVVDHSKGRVMRPLEAGLRRRQAAMERELTAFDLLTGNCSIARDTFRALGGFDASLPSCEDLELALRIQEHGLTIRYWPAAGSIEQFSRGTDLFVGGAYRRGLAHAMIAGKHPRAALLLRLGRPIQASLIKRVIFRLLWIAVAFVPVPDPNKPCLLPSTPWIWMRVATLYYWAGVHRGIASLHALRRLACPEAVILGYHVVDDLDRPAATAYRVATARFAEQIEYLKSQGFASITVSEWLHGLDGRWDLPERSVIVTFDDGDERTLETVQPMLAALSMTATVFVVSGLLGKTNEWDESVGFPRRSLVTSSQLITLAAQGWEIGSHSLTHRSLPKIPSFDLRTEASRSRDDLQSFLPDPVVTFSYPYGNYDDEVIAGLRRAGYQAACCSIAGINDSTTDRFKLRRIFVSPDDNVATFSAKLRNARRLGWLARASHTHQRVSHRLRRLL